MGTTDPLASCEGFENVLQMIGGKWKLWILRTLIFNGTMRFGELRRQVKGITQTMLTQQLRALEKDGLVSRTAYAEVPPRVEYAATDKAMELQKFFQAMFDWAESNVPTVVER